MTSKETKLRGEIKRMNWLMAIFGWVTLTAGLFVLFRFISFSKTPDGIYAGMEWMFAWFLWVPLIFFPAVGVFMACDRKYKLKARLSELDKKEDDAF